MTRRALLDALQALDGQRDAVVVVGAQAVYLRCGDADLSVATYTADADLSLDPRRLHDMPEVAQAMRDAGFALRKGETGIQPGQWVRAERVGAVDVLIPVDLLVPAALDGGGRSRRSATIPPHEALVARKVPGLELATVDHSSMSISSLEAGDGRRLEAKVAGATALLVAKAFKIADRLVSSRGDRLADKDAGDVLRIILTVPAEEVATTLGRLLNDPEVGETARVGLDRLRAQFGRRRGAGIAMASSALAGSLEPEVIAELATGFVAQLPVLPAG